MRYIVEKYIYEEYFHHFVRCANLNSRNKINVHMCLIGFSSKRFIDDLNFRAAQELFYFRDTYNKVIVLESIQMLIIVDWAFNGGT